MARLTRSQKIGWTKQLEMHCACPTVCPRITGSAAWSDVLRTVRKSRAHHTASGFSQVLSIEPIHESIRLEIGFANGFRDGFKRTKLSMGFGTFMNIAMVCTDLSMNGFLRRFTYVRQKSVSG